MNAKHLMTGAIVGALALAGCMSLEERLASNDPNVKRAAEYELVSNSRRNGTEADRIAVINRVTDLGLLQEIAKTATPEVKHGNSVTPSTIPDGTAALAKLNDQKILAALACAAKAKEIRIAASGKVTDQAALVAVYGAARDAEVKKVVLNKMEASSLQKLPYSADLIPYWAKISDQKILAKIYRDGYAKLPENERVELAKKFSEEPVIVEMVTSPSEQEVRDEEQKRERKGYELEREMKSAKEKAKDCEQRAARYKRDWAFGRAKEEEETADKFKAKYAQAQKELNALRSAGPKWLYVTNDVARAALFGYLKQDTLVTMAKAKIEAQSFEDWNERKRVENLKDGVAMVTKISNPKDVENLSAAVIKKIYEFRNRCSKGWCHEWGDKDKQIVKDMKNQLGTKLTDDMLESIATSDPNTLNDLCGMFKDKARLSKFGFSRIQNAVKGGKESEIINAWRKYRRAVSNDEMLKTLSVSSIYLRRPAFDQIKDEKVKTATLVAIKDALNKELKDLAAKQGALANFIAEIGNGEDLVAWLKIKSEQTELQNKEAFGKMKGRMVVLRGEVKNIGQTMFASTTYVSLRVAKVGIVNNVDVQFNVADSLKPTVIAWMKGETHIMRGKLTSTGDLSDDAKCEDGEIISEEKFNEAVGLKEAMENVKWQLKEIEEKKVPPVQTRPSRFGNAVKAAAGWIKGGVDDIKASGDDLKKAGEILQGLLN